LPPLISPPPSLFWCYGLCTLFIAYSCPRCGDRSYLALVVDGFQLFFTIPGPQPSPLTSPPLIFPLGGGVIDVINKLPPNLFVLNPLSVVSMMFCYFWSRGACFCYQACHPLTFQMNSSSPKPQYPPPPLAARDQNHSFRLPFSFPPPMSRLSCQPPLPWPDPHFSPDANTKGLVCRHRRPFP